MRAVSRAALGLIVTLCAPGAGRAQAPDASRSDLLRSGAHSVPGWWAAPGRPGWLPDAGTGDGYMWTLGGLVAGAWSVDLAGRDSPAAIPPGAVGAQESSAWFDTVAVTAGEGAAWNGYDATLAQAAAGPGLTRPGRDRRPRSDLLLSTGTERNRDNALSLWRGDSLSGVRVEATSGSRGPAGSLANSERDMYQLGAATGMGHNSALIVFSHRRSSASLVGGELQQVTSESGSGGYEYHSDRWRVGVSMRHAHDQHESFGVAVDEDGLRLATRSGARVEIERRSGGGRLAVRGDWNDTQVITTPDAPGPDRARALWGAVRWEGPFAGGQLSAGAGVGHHDAIGSTTFVPSVAWTFADAPLHGRLVGERVVTPVWSDLAAGEKPFIQDVWTGGMEVGAGSGHGLSGTMSFLAGRADHRAVIERLPLEALALRSGYREDPEPYHFGLVVMDAGWSSRSLSIGAEAFALARDANSIQPLVDPARGGRVFATAERHFFQGDLGVRPRAEAWLFGPRESEATPSHVLPGYVTATVAIEFTIADAMITIEGRNLEDTPRPQTWVDSSTGVEALGPGREIRTILTWRLWN